MLNVRYRTRIFLQKINISKLLLKNSTFRFSSEIFQKTAPHINNEEMQSKALEINIKDNMKNLKAKNKFWQKFDEVNAKFNVDLGNLEIDQENLLNNIINNVEENQENILSFSEDFSQNETLVKTINDINQAINNKNENYINLDNAFNDLFFLLESHLKENELDQSYMPQHCLNILKFIDKIYTQKNDVNIPNDIFLKVVNKYLDSLNNLEAISVDLAKNNEMILYKIISKYQTRFYRSGKNSQENIENFNSSLQRILEKSISTLTISNTELNNVDAGEFYFVLSNYYLNIKNYDKSEEYALKILEIFTLKLKHKDLKFIQPYWILAEIHKTYFKDIKESYILINEAYDIIKHNIGLSVSHTDNNNERIELIKFQVCFAKYQEEDKLNKLFKTPKNEQLSKEIENLQFIVNNINSNILEENNQELFMKYFDVLFLLANKYEVLDYRRKSYHLYKKCYFL